MTRTQKVLTVVWHAPVLVPASIAVIGASIIALPVTIPIALLGRSALREYEGMWSHEGEIESFAHVIVLVFTLAAAMCTFLPFFGIVWTQERWSRVLRES